MIRFDHEARPTPSTARPTASSTPPTASARTATPTWPTAWSRARSSNARSTTGASTSPTARRARRRSASRCATYPVGEQRRQDLPRPRSRRRRRRRARATDLSRSAWSATTTSPPSSRNWCWNRPARTPELAVHARRLPAVRHSGLRARSGSAISTSRSPTPRSGRPTTSSTSPPPTRRAAAATTRSPATRPRSGSCASTSASPRRRAARIARPARAPAYVFSLKPGDTVTAIGPFGDFHIKPTAEGNGLSRRRRRHGAAALPPRASVRNRDRPPARSASGMARARGRSSSTRTTSRTSPAAIPTSASTSRCPSRCRRTTGQSHTGLHPRGGAGNLSAATSQSQGRRVLSVRPARHDPRLQHHAAGTRRQPRPDRLR